MRNSAAVADRRDEGVLRALDDLQPDGAAAEPGAEEVLQVAQHRLEDVLQIVVVVGGIVVRAPLRRREGRELAGEPQQLLIQPLGMHVARAAEVLQHRDVAVENLQHEIVDALQPAARRRIGGVARQLLELVVDPADHPVESSPRRPDAPSRSSSGGTNCSSKMIDLVAHLAARARSARPTIAGLRRSCAARSASRG